MFTSLVFFLILPALISLYWLSPAALRSTFTLIASLVIYYIFGSLTSIIVLMLVIFYSYFAALLVSKYARMTSANSSLGLWVSITMLLIPLMYFKYSNFFFSQLGEMPFHLNSRSQILVPLGLSFFTFKALGYVIDAGRGRVQICRNPITYAAYVSFFPQVSCGPISRAQDLIPQFSVTKRFSRPELVLGCRMVLWGLFAKYCIADAFAIYVDAVYGKFLSYNGKSCLIASLAYSIQIYADFYAYSIISLGISKMLGFDVIANFRRPYLASSLTEFWRRWHISLSTWLRDYIYIPLGGGRVSSIRKSMNVLLTFMMSGLWHGANWTFIIWGILHGTAQVVENFASIFIQRKQGFIYLVLTTFATFAFVNFAWIFFRTPTIGLAFEFIRHIYANWNIGIPIQSTSMKWYFLVLFGLKEILDECLGEKMLIYNCSFRIVRWAGYIVTSALIVLWGAFDAGSFIYVGF